jgi:hypothetical protein
MIYTNEECRMVCHASCKHLVAHRQAHENLRGNAFHSQGRVVLEAKTPIERRITDQDAALRPQATNLLQSFIHECLTNPLPLKTWRDGDRSKSEPLAIFSVDLDRREGDLPDDFFINLGNQRERHGTIGPQTFDDQMFGLVAVWMVGKCGDENFSNRSVVGWCFEADNHLGTFEVWGCLGSETPS